MRPCDRCMVIVPNADLKEVKIGMFGDYWICGECYKGLMKWMGKDNAE